MRYLYPVDLEPEPEGGYVVTFPDVPEAITQGDDRDEALRNAVDALVCGLSFYVDGKKPLPVPSPLRGSPGIEVPPLVAAKLALYSVMLEHGLTNVALAKRLGVAENAVRRLLDLDHSSKIELVDAALRELGRRLVVEVRDAA